MGQLFADGMCLRVKGRGDFKTNMGFPINNLFYSLFTERKRKRRTRGIKCNQEFSKTRKNVPENKGLGERIIH